MKDWPWYGHFLLAVIVFALLFFVYFKPQNTKLTALKQEREKTEAEVTNLKQKNLQLSRIEEELVDLRKILNELEAIIPKRKEIWDILKKMQQLAINSRLNIVKFLPKGEVDMEFYYEWPISIEITGNYHNLAMFFDRLSNFSRLFNVEDFSIKSLTKQTEASTISAAYTAKTYIFREETPPGERSR
ncbi:MAG: type 4a pilus biogenesis protein PilO [Candidatus Aminicenantes bacterium]|nr:type 4a pilus biogenesis protein PilO [Candidatus Aminicenantes bacterium]